MSRVAAWANTISPIATTQLTSMELVIGKPKGRAISTALADKPCSAGFEFGSDELALCTASSELTDAAWSVRSAATLQPQLTTENTIPNSRT
jgi:hypothetical protein